MRDVVGGENTATTCCKSVELVVEVTAKRLEETAVCHFSHTDNRTKNGIVWTAARHRAECHPYLEKS